MQKLGGIKQLKISVLRIFCLPFLKRKEKVIDYGPWIPLFLKAFENDNNIEVHVIAPYSYQKEVM